MERFHRGRREMPTNCCVPLCTKKDKRDNQTGKKISFFRFAKEENLKKQWIHAIRRDVGPNFSINKGTRVCSRHFREEDLQRGLNGKVEATTLAKKKATEASEAVDSSNECSDRRN